MPRSSLGAAREQALERLVTSDYPISGIDIEWRLPALERSTSPKGLGSAPHAGLPVLKHTVLSPQSLQTTRCTARLTADDFLSSNFMYIALT